MHGKKMLVTTDLPVSAANEDFFEVEKYISGLGSFICECETPMTIAIQGDWGTGKTSFMNLIRNNIDHAVVPVWFNTWQFSQFNLDDQLPILLLTALSKKLDAGQKEVLDKFINTLIAVSNAAVSSTLNVDLKGTAEAFTAKNAFDTIEELRDTFQQSIKSTITKSKGKDRVVIFVDDLDRLNPKRAIEILEVLKIFLDCKNCVFVLAIDYDVVCKGVGMKYGDQMSEDKGKSFFDKIIQVPFKMPVTQYKIQKYVDAYLNKVGIHGGDVALYESLIGKSIGCNPRGMKRLFNAYLLLQKVHASDLSGEGMQRALFAFLCLQMSYEAVYNLISSSKDTYFTKEIVEVIAREAKLAKNSHGNIPISSESNDLYEEIKAMYPSTADENEALSKIQPFLYHLCDAITDDNDTLSDEEYQKVCAIISISETTVGVTTKVAAPMVGAKKVVYVLNVIQEIYQSYQENGSHFKMNEAWTKALATIASRESVTSSTISDKCCRQLKLSATQFQANTQELIDTYTQCGSINSIKHCALFSIILENNSKTLDETKLLNAFQGIFS
ncbi:P-loop NTPase fold protein [Bengtsoniella intestinalis]|uniref:KAP family P-loop NTPase fold protein n=1 Tax=Bengtsoniella intestinalis TaxID=3073143 RepID=UPI00391F08EB